MIVLLHITVKYLQQFAMDLVKVFAQENTELVGFDGNNVDDLKEKFVPDEFGIASQK